jgi:hypothetical protein
VNNPLGEGQDSKPTSGLNDRLMGSITQFIIGAFVVLILVFWASAIWSSCQQSKSEARWFDLTKAGFTVLGSAFTLILGYYFGHRLGAQEADRKVREKDNDLRKAKDAVADNKQAVDELVERISENITPDAPEKLANASRRQSGKPAAKQSSGS